MSIKIWVGCYIVDMAVWIWIVFAGGAERIEGADGFWLPRPLTSHLDSDTIRTIGWIAIVVSTIAFVLGFYYPSVRMLW